MRATIPAAPVVEVESVPEKEKEIKEEWVEKPFMVLFMQMIWNVFQYTTERLSYEFAVALATGATGGDPLVELRSGEWFAQDIVMDVAGEAIAALSGLLSDVNIHFDLCAPGELGRLNLQLGLRAVYRPEPRCDFQEALTNWTNVYTGIVNELETINEDPTRYVLSYFASSINPRATELTASIEIYSQVFESANEKKNLKLAEWLAKKGYKDVASIISGQIETPADIIENKATERLAGNDEQMVAKHWYDTMLAEPKLWKQLGLSGLSIFANTFLSTFTDRLLIGFFTGDIPISDDAFDVESIGFRGGVEGAEAYFKDVFATSPIALDSYSALSDFVFCPTVTTIELNNCAIDTDFATAIGSSDSGDPFTVQNAIDEGLIHADWPLISETDSRNLDKDCYSYGYCYTNLAKLRKARIIPVGWEIAASLQGTDSDTLGDVMGAFDDCNADGERDEDHPYCHLIDPNWTLKYPSTQCKASVPGQLVSNDGKSRFDECVDAPSCIQEDASGDCIGGYGYCMREQNIYQFRGQDCPEQYGTCLSFSTEDGDEADLLFNTVDESVCDSDNAGCLWYATEKDQDADGAFDWPDINDVPTEDDARGTYQERIYFNAEVEDCEEDNAGCRQLVEDDDDVELNYLMNPSFEDDEDENDVPDFWLSSGTPGYDISGEYSISGDAAVNPGSSSFLYQQNIPIQGSMFYTLSFYAAQPSSSASNALTVYIITDSADGSEDVDLTGTSYDSDNCTLTSLDGDLLKESFSMSVTPTDDSYERFTCTFTSPTLDDPSAGVRIAFLDFGGDVLVDAVQLEADEDVDNFREGYGSALSGQPLTYYKLPPAYLGCEGDSDDPEACDDYAQMCTAQDVGCDLYTPTNGNPSVPGIANDLDECPSECAGYDTYKQEPTRYEPDGEFPEYFIPDTAISCSEQYVGCDEFTNLTDESQEYYTSLRACLTTDQTTDEAVYYTWEGSDLEGFQLVSWNLLESDESDAPCVTWATTDSGITCNDPSTAVTNTDCDAHEDIFTEPNCREFYDADGDIFYRLFEDTVTITDSCISYRKTDAVGDSSAERELNCEAASGYWDSAVGDCLFYGYSEESDSCPATQNGCREYTGGAGRNSSVIFEDDNEDEDIDEYVVYNATAEVSNESVATDGHSLHAEITGASGYVAVGVATMDDCSETDGCTADTDGTCAETDGCDAEVGTLGLACTIAEDEEFCGELTDGLEAGKTYVMSFWAKSSAATAYVTPTFWEEAGSGDSTTFETVSLSTNWEEFTVGPLGTTDLDAFDESAMLVFYGASGDDFYVDNITLRQTEEEITIIKDSWETPSTCDETEEGASSDQYHLGCQEYSDGDGDVVYLKSFTRLCEEEVIGCSAFFDTQASESPYAATYNVRCDNVDGSDIGTKPDVATAAVACEIAGETVCTIPVGSSYCLFDWEGMEPRSDTGGPIDLDDADMTLAFGAEMESVAADQKVFFVADSTFACDSSVMGCMEVGLPTFSTDGTVVDSWESAYLLNQPDEYSDQLCSHESLFCDAWDNTEGSTYYFKNPNEKTCEYKSSVSLNGTEYSGWFRTGTSNFCYGSGTCSDDDSVSCETDADCATADVGSCEITSASYLDGGTASGIWRNGDDDYDGWGGTCESQYNLCTEFIDPADTGDALYGEDEGESYFFINDDLLDDSNLSTSKQCNGQVSQKKGCVLFNNIVEGELTYSASASYIRSVHASDFEAGAASYDLVDPISCPDGGVVTLADGTTEVDLCTQRCAYENELLHPYDDYSSETGEALYTFTGACLSDTDCPDVESDGSDLVSGACATVSEDADNDGSADNALEDDTNAVQKVNLDRACEEWLACDSTTSVWDTSTASYKISCDSVGACTEYSALGDTTFCAEWDIDQTAIVLSADRYASRDVGWYGDEYSGLAIPGQIPAQYLSQVNVNPSKWCVSSDGEVSPTQLDCAGQESDYCGEATTYAYPNCESAEEDYRLVYIAGVCDEENGEACTVGFCSDNGRTCGNDDDCDGDAFCATGFCSYEPSSSTSCDTDAECATQTSATSCVEGVCQNVTSTACTTDAVSTYCTSSGTASCTQSAATQTGACYNEQCLLDPLDEDGDGEAETFTPDEAEEMACRGWPESDAPFPNSVVESWVSAAAPSGTPSSDVTDISDVAYETLSTFEKVNLCGGGEDCDCSYEKVSYGDTSTIRYYEQDSENIATYLCVGGTYDGAECLSAGNGYLTDSPTIGCGVYESGGVEYDNGGTCEIKSQEQSLVGWQGYCLERDARVRVNGDSSESACLTWLPIDQLAGSSDIYGKYTEAGYPLEESFICGEADMFVDVTVSSIGCAEHESSHQCWSDKSEDYEDLLRGDGNAVCPYGMYAVMSRCIYDDTGGDGNTDSVTGTSANECEGGSTNDHPYFCVPGDVNYGATTGEGYDPENGTFGWDYDDTEDALYFPVHTDPDSEWYGEKCYDPVELEEQGILEETFDLAVYPNTTTGVKRSDIDYFDNNGDADGDGYLLEDDSSDGNTVFKIFSPDANDTPSEFDTLYEDYYDDCEIIGFPLSLMQEEGYFDYDMEDSVYYSCGYYYDTDADGAQDDLVYPVYCEESCTAGCTWDDVVIIPEDANSPYQIGTYSLYDGIEFEGKFYPACTALIQVATTDENRAWTDRVLYDRSTPFALEDQDPEMSYTQDTESTPFGLAFTPTEINDDTDPGPARALACEGTINFTTSSGGTDTGTAIFFPEVDGSCAAGSTAYVDYYEENGSAEPQARLYTQGAAGGGHPEDSTLGSDLQIITAVGSGTGYGSETDYSALTDVVSTLATRIAQIFAAPFTLFTFDPQGGDEGRGAYDSGVAISSGSTTLPNDYAGAAPADYVYDITNEGDSNGSDGTPSAPIVRSLSTICVDSQCQEGSDDAFSVNGFDEATLTGQDSYVADVKFFVEANENQMPIRRMIVDWQDDLDGADQSGSTSSDNYYKNARGLDATNNEICGVDPENWGEESDACTSGYYNYTHIYTCSESFLETLPTCDSVDEDGDSVPEITPCSNGSSCVFRPRVHVRDNWGWCTGTCPDTVAGVDGTEKCYGSMEDMGSSDAENECDLLRPDGGSAYTEDDPWVYYNGMIVVEP